MTAIRTNLYQPTAHNLQTAARRWWLQLGLGVLIMLGLSGALPGLYYQHRLAGQLADNRQLQKHIQYTVSPRAELKKLARTTRGLQRQQAVLADLQQSQRATAWWLDELITALPEAVRLTRLRETQGQLELEGQATSRDQVSAYLRHLGQSRAFEKPRLVIMQAQQARDSKAAVSFSLEARRRTAAVSAS